MPVTSQAVETGTKLDKVTVLVASARKVFHESMVAEGYTYVPSVT